MKSRVFAFVRPPRRLAENPRAVLRVLEQEAQPPSFQASAPGPEDLLGSVTDVALGPILLKDVPVTEVPRLVREISGAFDRIAACRAVPFSLP